MDFHLNTKRKSDLFSVFKNCNMEMPSRKNNLNRSWERERKWRERGDERKGREKRNREIGRNAKGRRKYIFGNILYSSSLPLWVTISPTLL